MLSTDEARVMGLIEKALLKKATGFTSVEVTNEYQCTDGEQVLVRKKEVIKDVPPDVSAAKILIDKSESAENGLTELSDEELEREKIRLIALLNEKIKNGEKNEGKKNQF